MTGWAKDAIFYHLYPLGWAGAPPGNDFVSAPVPRLAAFHEWLPHLAALGVNALYLGPVWESSAHGYDTADYYRLDRRLGTNETLRDLSTDLHARGMRLILDGVFNHVGRDFWAFRDLQARGEASPYRDWFAGVRFDARSPLGDPFAYDAWEGHFELVTLNLGHPDVRAHLFGAIDAWVRDFGIDGLRLDVAYALDQDFIRALAAHCRALRPDFWLLGEVIHGDYRQWVYRGGLDATTNYVCYKGLWSSHADANYFEIAYALKQQFAEGGTYRGLPLYTFADNHDVDRVASRLTDPAQLYPLYALLFTMPGVPSLYYGSEWGIAGARTATSDAALRPALDLATSVRDAPHPALAPALARFAALRHRLVALRRGDYRELLVAHQQLAFARQSGDERVIVALNAANHEITVTIPAPFPGTRTAVDLLNGDESFPIEDGKLRVALPPHWARVMVVR